MATIIKANTTPTQSRAYVLTELAPPHLARRAADNRPNRPLPAESASREEAIGQSTSNASTLSPLLQQLADELNRTRQEWLVHWQSQAVRLAAAMASRIIRRQVEIEPKTVLPQLAEALELAAGKPDLRILLHPDDKQQVGSDASRMAAKLARCANAQVVSDESITRGGCRVETRHGTIDYTIEVQLDRIVEELIG